MRGVGAAYKAEREREGGRGGGEGERKREGGRDARERMYVRAYDTYHLVRHSALTCTIHCPSFFSHRCLSWPSPPPPRPQPSLFFLPIIRSLLKYP